MKLHNRFSFSLQPFLFVIRTNSRNASASSQTLVSFKLQSQTQTIFEFTVFRTCQSCQKLICVCSNYIPPPVVKGDIFRDFIRSCTCVSTCTGSMPLIELTPRHVHTTLHLSKFSNVCGNLATPACRLSTLSWPAFLLRASQLAAHEAQNGDESSIQVHKHAYYGSFGSD